MDLTTSLTLSTTIKFINNFFLFSEMENGRRKMFWLLVLLLELSTSMHHIKAENFPKGPIRHRSTQDYEKILAPVFEKREERANNPTLPQSNKNRRVLDIGEGKDVPNYVDEDYLIDEYPGDDVTVRRFTVDFL